jgi:hypothetical protein
MQAGCWLRFASWRDNYGERSEPKTFFPRGPEGIIKTNWNNSWGSMPNHPVSASIRGMSVGIICTSGSWIEKRTSGVNIPDAMAIERVQREPTTAIGQQRLYTYRLTAPSRRPYFVVQRGHGSYIEGPTDSPIVCLHRSASVGIYRKPG